VQQNPADKPAQAMPMDPVDTSRSIAEADVATLSSPTDMSDRLPCPEFLTAARSWADAERSREVAEYGPRLTERQSPEVPMSSDQPWTPTREMEIQLERRLEYERQAYANPLMQVPLQAVHHDYATLIQGQVIGIAQATQDFAMGIMYCKASGLAEAKKKGKKQKKEKKKAKGKRSRSRQRQRHHGRSRWHDRSCDSSEYDRAEYSREQESDSWPSPSPHHLGRSRRHDHSHYQYDDSEYSCEQESESWPSPPSRESGRSCQYDHSYECSQYSSGEESKVWRSPPSSYSSFSSSSSSSFRHRRRSHHRNCSRS